MVAIQHGIMHIISYWINGCPHASLCVRSEPLHSRWAGVLTHIYSSVCRQMCSGVVSILHYLSLISLCLYFTPWRGIWKCLSEKCVDLCTYAVSHTDVSSAFHIKMAKVAGCVLNCSCSIRSTTRSIVGMSIHLNIAFVF